jgi:hypothetical protein
MIDRLEDRNRRGFAPGTSRRAWELRSRHPTCAQIGEELGVDPSTAYDAVQRAAQMIPTEGAAEMTQAMLEDMDRMSRQLRGVVERKRDRVDRGGVVTCNGQEVMDDGPGLQAIAQLLQVQERNARLMGLDAPTRRAVDVITHDVLMGVLADLEADLARKEAQLARHET